MRSFFLPNWSPPDDPARPLPAEGRPWPSGDNDDDGDDDGDEDDDEDGDEDGYVQLGWRRPDNGGVMASVLRTAIISICGLFKNVVA